MEIIKISLRTSNLPVGRFKATICHGSWKSGQTRALQFFPEAKGAKQCQTGHLIFFLRPGVKSNAKQGPSIFSWGEGCKAMSNRALQFFSWGQECKAMPNRAIQVFPEVRGAKQCQTGRFIFFSGQGCKSVPNRALCFFFNSGVRSSAKHGTSILFQFRGGTIASNRKSSKSMNWDPWD